MKRIVAIGVTALSCLFVATRAEATSFTFSAVMNGAAEVPPNASPATGFTLVTFDDILHQLTVDINWSGIIGGNPSMGHIHCCIPVGQNVGVAVGYPGFPPTTSGTYFHVFNTLDSSIYTSAFLNNFGGGTAAGAEAALLNGFLTNQAYSNIHNTQFPGGEIRGILTTPEPATLSLLALGLAGLGVRAIRRRRQED